MSISITNRSTVLSNAALQAALPAFNHYARIVCSAWHLSTPTITLTDTPSASSWLIGVFDDSDQAGALGYHDFTIGGKPLAKVFAKTDLDYGYNWQVTLTHELAEMLVDPWIAAAWQTGDTRFHALEVGDPVEADELAFAYTAGIGAAPVMLSDFALPSWFIPGASGPFDYKHHCSAPLQVLAGGYAQYFQNGSWHQVGPNGQHMPMDSDDARLRARW